MKTLAEISAEYHIPLKKVKRMFLEGALINVRDSSPLEEIVLAIKKANPLSSYQRVLLMKNPDWLSAFGKHEFVAKIYLKETAAVSAEAMPAEMHPGPLIDNCARGDVASLPIFAQWITSVIPSDGCDYHYVATRALFNVPEAMLDLVAKGASRAITKARKTPALDGMSETIDRTTRFFPRREILEFDL